MLLMHDETSVKPHGGSLVNLLVDDQRAGMLKEIVINLPDITLNDRQLCDLELLSNGAFSPLTGFMTRSDYESVLDRMRLQSDLLWPIPICLDVDELQACILKTSGK
jgi:sulfate adenylyltransferase